MPGLEAVIDVIYNPDKTELILRAEELGGARCRRRSGNAGGAGSVRGRIFSLDRKFEDAGAEIARVTASCGGNS